MQDEERSIPLAALPSDALRDGLTTFQDRLVERHPVQALLKEVGDTDVLQTEDSQRRCVGRRGGEAPSVKGRLRHGNVCQTTHRRADTRSVRGIAVFGQVSSLWGRRRGRLPSLPSSNFSSDVYFGRLGTFDVESYLGLEEFTEKPPIDVHSQMEQHHGLGTRYAKRGIL